MRCIAAKTPPAPIPDTRSMGEARRFSVTGRVQGVFFRDSTRQVAQSLQLSGHAINLPDGSVEVLACGSTQALDQLAKWLRDGPRLANVAGVVAEEVDWQELEGFRVG